MEDLKLTWKTVLPLCQDCRAKGNNPLVRTRRRNGATNEQRAQRARLATYVAPRFSNEDDALVEVTNGVATNNVDSLTSGLRW